MSTSPETKKNPAEIDETAKAESEKLLPTKSSAVYEAAFEKFTTWCSQKNVSVYSENAVLVYFSEMAKRMKSSSLWSHYSMIKSLLKLRHDVDISKYYKLRAFLKKQNEGYSPKKARVLTKDQFDNFISNAPDEKYLAVKVILIFGISGACRCDELYKMKLGDIEEQGSILLIKIPDSKTNKSRTFTVIGETYINIYRKYVSQRPEGFKEKKLFIKYQNGRCYRMVMGIHKIGSAAKEAATYLKLPDCNQYTGHCLRRTSATLLVNTGADITTLKRHGGWKSNSVAEGYIEESLENKKDIGRRILLSDTNNTTECDNRPTTSNHNAGIMERMELVSTHVVDSSNPEEITGHRLIQHAKKCTFNIKINNYYKNQQ